MLPFPSFFPRVSQNTSSGAFVHIFLGPGRKQLGTAAVGKKEAGLLWRSVDFNAITTFHCVTQQLLAVKCLFESNLAFIHFIQSFTVR